MLDRRRFFTGATAAAAATLGTRRARAAGAKSSQLRLGYLISANSQSGAGATAMAEEISRRTEGRIAIQQFPDAALGGEVEMLKGLQIGAIDLAFITGGALSVVVPEAGIFNIPFLFTGAAHAHAVLDGKIGDEYQAMFAAKDLVPLAWAENGLRHLTNSRRPIVTPEDLKGLKLRVPQSDVMVTGFRALGTEVSSLPFPQLYSALESGVFDAEENPIATILSAKFAQVQKFLTLSGHVYDPSLILMSPDAHDDLSEADRAIFREAAKAGAAASRAFAANAEQTGIATLQQAGMQVVGSIDRSRFVAAMADAVPVYDKQFGRARIDQIRAVA
jgi:tripartite ATP-independent transporter DctP family solute receptor